MKIKLYPEENGFIDLLRRSFVCCQDEKHSEFRYSRVFSMMRTDKKSSKKRSNYFHFGTIHIICLLIFCAQFAYTQNKSETPTVLHMQDGSIYKGEIISEDAFEIVLKTESVGEIIIPAFLVKHRNANGIAPVSNNAKYHKTTGNFLTVDFSFNIDRNSLFQFNVIYGKRLSPKYNVGVGVAFSEFTSDFLFRGQQLFQPYVYGQYYWNDKNWRLFTDVKLGYGIDVTGTQDFGIQTQDSSGGVYANPGIGVEIANRKNMKWSIKLSQQIQKSNRTGNFQDNFQNPIFITSNTWYNRTTLSTGVNF